MVQSSWPISIHPTTTLYKHTHNTPFAMASTQPKTDVKSTEPKPEQPVAEKKTAVLEEDDEFEDFPVDG